MKRRKTLSNHRHRRAVIDFKHSQTGEVQLDNAAGRDIYNGVQAEVIINILREDIADERHSRRLVVAAIERVDSSVRSGQAETGRQIVAVGLVVVLVVVAALFILGIVLLTF